MSCSYSSSSGPYPNGEGGGDLYYALEMMEWVRIALDPDTHTLILIMGKPDTHDGTRQDAPASSVALTERSTAKLIAALQKNLQNLRLLPSHSQEE